MPVVNFTVPTFEMEQTIYRGCRVSVIKHPNTGRWRWKVDGALCGRSDVLRFEYKYPGTARRAAERWIDTALAEPVPQL